MSTPSRPQHAGDAADAADIAPPARALLELVESDRARQSTQILDAARSQAATLRVQAQAQARARMRQAYTEQRRLSKDRLAAAQARLATQRRLSEQQRSAALLRLAWEQLPGELQTRWREPASRAAWVARVLAAARAHMPAVAWRILHAPDWPAAEQQALAQQLLAAGSPAAPLFEPDARISAGLKVHAGGNVIDGTLDGLLAERTELEARLLRLLEAPS
ncbi:MAG: hypothetical protein Q8R72_16935 [Hylemonella sp.]|nr:hypothetical protein [Hylemonella sp.]